MKQKDLPGLAVLAIVLGIVAACTTTPRPVPAAKLPALHGNLPNAGILELTAGGARIDEQARATYNGLIAKFGTRFNPPLAADAGVVLTIGKDLVPSLWMDKQHVADWATMQFWSDNPAFIPLSQPSP